jgi:putative ABC transport system permease protein
MTARQRDWQSWLSGAALLASLVLVAVWQADSLRAGLYVSVGLAVVGVALLLVSRLLVRVVSPLSRSPRFALRHAVISLGRPGNQTRVVLMSVGLGCFFILSMRAVQRIFRRVHRPGRRNAPIWCSSTSSPDHRGRLDGRPYAAHPARLWPMMRGRVVGVEGKRVKLANPDAVRRQGRLTREFGITYRDALQDNERLLAGAFWSAPLAADKTPEGFDTEVSIEENVHDDAQVDVGDAMRFDIGGRIIRARVSSIRKVTWDEAQNGGFMFVFRPNSRDRAHPFPSWASSQLRRVIGGRRRAPARSGQGLPQRLGHRRARDPKAIREVVDNATLRVTIVGSVTLFGGVLILVGPLR